VASLALLAQAAVASAAPGPSEIGSFSAPFTEPTLNGAKTSENCVPHQHGPGQPPDGHTEDCKPAGGSMSLLRSGNIVYWDALEGTENIQNGTASEYGTVSLNDQARVLRFRNGKPFWYSTTPEDGGANPHGYDNEPLLPPPLSSTETSNDGALFCSDFNLLPDGRILAAGGTAYYNDPGPDGGPGVAELEGLRNARIYDPAHNRWTQTGSMHHGRWYPTMVTLGSGQVFVAGGVQKLLKPVYPSHPQDSGRNVVQTETYSPSTGKWTENGAAAERSLPLYPRLHLLPNGHVFYNAAGQVFNPFGQSYDEATWNFTAAYDPKTKAWATLGLPGVGTALPGFRGSTFSIMLPLQPGTGGAYRTASFLSAGGIAGTTPGTYLASRASAITTVDTTKIPGDPVTGGAVTTTATGDLNDARWYSTAVLLPTGQVMAFSGADRDEVDFPGTGFPTTRAELFDPATRTWKPMATAHQARTYHNTAILLRDGRVLVGGHAPIPTMYGAHQTLPGGFSPNEGRDPSFEIYSPPYLFAGKRPVIKRVSAARYTKTLRIRVKGPARDIKSVVLVRNPSVTHLVDGDQRSVVLRVVKRKGRILRVAPPPNGNVAPPGMYMLFVNRAQGSTLIPSVSASVRLR
jgi:hypothetical protein